MTDFKGFNPDKNLGRDLRINRQNQGKQAEPGPEANDSQPPVDPYADLKMDPSRMMDLLAAQGKSNQVQFAATSNTGSIESSIEAFTAALSPERHSFTSRLLEQTFQNEFGQKPGAGLLQDILDDYLIGQPVIQAS